MWPRDVKLNPSITTANLKKKQPMLLQDISIRTIQQCPYKDLNLPSRCADKNSLLTSPMMKRKLQFCNEYLQWTFANWKTVIISDKSTYKLVRGGSKLVRRYPGSSRYDSKSTVNPLQEHNIDWSQLFGCLEQNMLPSWDIHQCHHFMHDGVVVYPLP